MANKTIAMQKIHAVLRLYQSDYSFRAISQQTGIHRSIVKQYLDRIEAAGVSVDDALELTPLQLSQIIYSVQDSSPPHKRQRDFDLFSQYALEELKRKHVTLQLLHAGYLRKYTDGYQYSQFCELMLRLRKSKDLTMLQQCNPGDLMQVDFTGDKLYWVDSESGERFSAEVLVVTLGFSGLTFVQALSSQNQEEFIRCLNNALRFFGGVPVQIRMDNLKAGIIKADRYEPSFNKLLSMFCEHYGLVPDATRVRKPQDKAQVESHVRIVYERIFAPLRDRIFTSIENINEAIEPLLTEHNSRSYRGSKRSRLDFYQEERSALQPLKENLFIPKHYKKAIIQSNYHIWIGEDEHYYSVPFSYAGKSAEVIYDYECVEVYCELQRIAFHSRRHRIGRYSTLPGHMPERHLKVKQGMDPDHLLDQADRIGPFTRSFVERVLSRGAYSAPNYKSCQGVLALSRKYSCVRMENAAQRALRYNNITYNALKAILLQNLDQVNTDANQPGLPFNQNTRGAGNYL
jgi:transposase